jgi:ZIP family zinc transporter
LLLREGGPQLGCFQEKVLAATILAALLSFLSTLLGGLASIKFKNKLQLILGFTAGVLVGVVAFDVFPEIMELVQKTRMSPRAPMTALVAGFLLFHIVEKSVLVHHSQEGSYEEHRHPALGLLSAVGLSIHSFLDGVGIGLGFQISSATGILIAMAVISHDFADGLNTGSLMLVHGNTSSKTVALILADATAPVLGALSTLFFGLPEKALLVYLGFFAGFLLYVGIASILIEAHREKSSLKTVMMTILGVAFIFVVSQFI